MGSQSSSSWLGVILGKPPEHPSQQNTGRAGGKRKPRPAASPNRHGTLAGAPRWHRQAPAWTKR
eukprot:4765214-Pyramimonas_sp.AAC.1